MQNFPSCSSPEGLNWIPHTFCSSDRLTPFGPADTRLISSGEYFSGGCSTKCSPCLATIPNLRSHVLTVPGSAPSSFAIFRIESRRSYLSAHLLASSSVHRLYGLRSVGGSFLGTDLEDSPSNNLSLNPREPNEPNRLLTKKIGDCAESDYEEFAVKIPFQCSLPTWLAVFGTRKNPQGT